MFRHDLMAKMLRNLIGVKPETDSGDLKRYVSPPPFRLLPQLIFIPKAARANDPRPMPPLTLIALRSADYLGA